MTKLGYSLFKRFTTARLLYKICVIGLSLALVFTSVEKVVARDYGNANAAYEIGLWGDVPYSAAQEIGVIKLIEDMNSHRLAFTAHDGDIMLTLLSYL